MLKVFTLVFVLFGVYARVNILNKAEEMHVVDHEGDNQQDSLVPNACQAELKDFISCRTNPDCLKNTGKNFKECAENLKTSMSGECIACLAPKVFGSCGGLSDATCLLSTAFEAMKQGECRSCEITEAEDKPAALLALNTEITGLFRYSKCVFTTTAVTPFMCVMATDSGVEPGKSYAKCLLSAPLIVKEVCSVSSKVSSEDDIELFEQEREKTSYWRGCSCDYFRGGCRIVKLPRSNRACYCEYTFFWTCAGTETRCSDRNSPYCKNPGFNKQSCQQGRFHRVSDDGYHAAGSSYSDCGGYRG